MAKFEIEDRDPSKMGLGQLIFALVTLKDDMENEFVCERHPYTECYSEYGGIISYNTQVVEAYTEFQHAIIDELDELGLVYEFGRDTR